MNFEEDLRRIALQEERLQFDHFDTRQPGSWAVACEKIAGGQLAIVIDIQLHGLPLLYFALQGTTPDNPEWVRRKRNIVRSFFRAAPMAGGGPVAS